MGVGTLEFLRRNGAQISPGPPVPLLPLPPDDIDLARIIHGTA